MLVNYFINGETNDQGHFVCVRTDTAWALGECLSFTKYKVIERCVECP